MKAFSGLLALSALAAAEDVLRTRRLTKRGLDENGNFNICECHGCRHALAAR